jgi:cell wall-associated NlpC family hydrolase
MAKVHDHEAAKLEDWAQSQQISDSTLIAQAHKLMGVPYLWGGTSSKGVDCSGFTKTVYLMHGLILPRDASQQVHKGKLVDDKKDFSHLEVGDLLFFGRHLDDGTERVVHVGMWIGDNKFIHASGDVHISSMDSTTDQFDEYNFNRYLRTKRIIGHDEDLPARPEQLYFLASEK